MRSVSLCFFFEDKENGPRTVKDVKLISAGKILENNRTVGECQSPLCDTPDAVTTMLVVVQPPTMEKGVIFISETCQKLLIPFCFTRINSFKIKYSLLKVH